jgi:3-oxoacyl-(acyl-carrier-protein) synthase
MRKAYQDANLDVSVTDYVECHGTGTAVGDPIEVEAIGRVFDRGSGSQLLLGSVSVGVRSPVLCYGTDKSSGQNKCRTQ